MPNDNSDRALTIGESGQPVKSRIPSSVKAHGIFMRLKRNDEYEARQRAKIQGQVDGNEPYSKAALVTRGQTWRANVNFREAESIVDDNTSAVWELLTDVPTLINPVIKDSSIDPATRVEWQNIIAEEFSDMLGEWDGFFFHTEIAASEMIKYGSGTMFWPDPFNWKYKAAKAASVLMPRKSKSTTGLFKIVFIRDELYVDDIFEMIYTPEKVDAASSLGWNVDTLKLFIIRAYYQGQKGTNPRDRYQLSDWESVQQEIKNNDLSWTETDMEALRIVHVYVVENDGNVSQYMIEDDNAPVSDKSFLYKREKVYNNICQALSTFFFNVGDGYAASVKGLGHKIYPHVELSNRVICSILDGSMLAASILLQPSTGGSGSEYRLMRIGPVTVLPEGTSAVQSSFQPNISHLTLSVSMLRGILNNNTGVFRPQSETGEETEKTARQVELEARKEARFTKRQAGIWYVQWDKTLREIYRRAVNADYPSSSEGYREAKTFIDRCRKRDVPEKVIRDMDNIRINATRSIGLGSAALASLTANELVSARPMFDERGKVNAARTWLASRVGQSNVDQYLPLVNRDSIATSQTTIASLENNDFFEGSPSVVGTDEDHFTHLSTHLMPAKETSDLFVSNPQGIDVVRAVQFLTMTIPHARQHLVLYQSDDANSGKARQFEAVLAEIETAFNSMQSEVAKIQQQIMRQRQEQMQTISNLKQQAQDNETIVKLAEIEKDFALELQKQQSIMAIRQQKAEHAMALKSQKAATDIATQT